MFSLVTDYLNWLFTITPQDVTEPIISQPKKLTEEQREKQELLCKKLKLKAALEKLNQKNGNKSTSSEEIRSTK